MITRTHVEDDISSLAVYSDCERYRYSLTRTWDESAQRVVYIMLNPSKATEQHNDPTIERCERRSRALGSGAFCAVNIFGWRETDPFKMRKASDPVGADNDREIETSVEWADIRYSQQPRRWVEAEI